MNECKPLVSDGSGAGVPGTGDGFARDMTSWMKLALGSREVARDLLTGDDLTLPGRGINENNNSTDERETRQRV